MTNYYAYISQYSIKCINEENSEKGEVDVSFGEAFMKEKNLIWALAYVGRMVRKRRMLQTRKTAKYIWSRF